MLIIYKSIHKGNTLKIADALGDVLGAKILDVKDVLQEDIDSSELIGFGSGIYIGKFHKNLIELIAGISEKKGKKSFIFSTSGMKRNTLVNMAHNHIKILLQKKGFEVIGDFNCLGYDTYGPLKYINGINKGRPNKNDVESAKKFAQQMKMGLIKSELNS